MFKAGVVTKGIELSPLQMRAAFRHIGYSTPPTPETWLSADTCMRFWAAMLIDKLKFLAPEQRAILAEEVVTGIAGLGDTIQAGDSITPMVVIADGRYATWHNRTGWLDLMTGNTVQAPRVRPLETTAFNLAEMFHRNQAACEEITKREAQNEQTGDT